MNSNTLIIIPARGGSKGIPNKNTKKLDGTPLFLRSVQQAERCGFENIFVSTDSADIAKLSNDYGSFSPFLRPKTISGDKSHMFEVYIHAVKTFMEMGKTYDYFLTLLPTMPFRTDLSVLKAHEIISSGDVDWVFTCNEYEHHPFRAFKISADSQLCPVFTNNDSVMFSNRQELPPFVRFNGGVIGGTVKNLLSGINEYNVNDNNIVSKGVLTTKDESIDIDDPIDFEFCEFILKNYKAR